MSVIIRLAKVGKRGMRAYRVVAVAKKQKRDSSPLEILGSYMPASPAGRQGGPGREISLNEKRIAYWQSVGADISLTVRNLLSKKENA